MPVVAGLTVWLGNMFFGAPAKSLAMRMNELAMRFSATGPAKKESSRLLEINLMQKSFERMKNAVLSFAKFAPVHIVRELMAGNKVGRGKSVFVLLWALT